MKKYTYNLVSKNGTVADKARMSESAAEKKNADPILKEKGAQWVLKVTNPFAGPREQKRDEARSNAHAPKQEEKHTHTAKAARDEAKWDAFGGRIGTRMSKINLEVINAGAKGATVLEVAEATKEKTGIVGAQLGWICSHKKLATRKEEGDTFRYFANVKS